MDRLRLALTANAVFSATSGAVLLLGARGLDAKLGLDSWFLAVVGMALIAYGGLISVLARRDQPLAGGRFATVIDVAWVAGAALILIGLPTAMTALGRFWLLAVSVAAAGFAFVQWSAMRTLDRAG